MIHIEFNEPNTQEWQRWRQRCWDKQRKHNEAVEAGKVSKVTNLYKGQKEQVYANPNGPFRGKCAYCEQGITNPHNQPGDVEHFRPKGKVTEEDGKTPLMVPDNGGSRRHPGYYWLAYDWKNLLLACNGCNTRQKDPNSGEMVGKGMVFPVSDFPAVHPGDENREVPLLINPVWDNPQDHLAMDSTGVLVKKSEKGRTTDRIFGLNLRGLPEARKERYEHIRMQVGLWLQMNRNSDEANKLKLKLIESEQGFGEHTIAVRKPIYDAMAQMDELNFPSRDGPSSSSDTLG